MSALLHVGVTLLLALLVGCATQRGNSRADAAAAALETPVVGDAGVVALAEGADAGVARRAGSDAGVAQRAGGDAAVAQRAGSGVGVAQRAGAASRWRLPGSAQVRPCSLRTAIHGGQPPGIRHRDAAFGACGDSASLSRGRQPQAALAGAAAAQARRGDTAGRDVDAADASVVVAPLPARLDSGAAVFAALRSQLAMQTCSDDRVVKRWVAWYGRAPRRLAANLERILPLLAHVLGQVRSAGLPGEFALLPIAESWYRIDARHGGTAGLWQFSAATGRGNGLRVDARVDERYAPAAATEAAITHLAALMRRFGDWRLAAMAYNAGEYRLARAVARDSAAASAAGHHPAGLSMTTYEYLAKLQALSCLVHEPQRIALVLPTRAFEPLSEAALLAMAPEPASATAGKVHQVRRGDSLWAIARRYGVALADLLRWNALDGSAVLQPGQAIRLHPQGG